MLTCMILISASSTTPRCDMSRKMGAVRAELARGSPVPVPSVAPAANAERSSPGRSSSTSATTAASSPCRASNSNTAACCAPDDDALDDTSTNSSGNCSRHLLTPSEGV